MSIKTDIYASAIRGAYDFLDKDPVNNLPKPGEYMDKFIPEGSRIGRLHCRRTAVPPHQRRRQH